MKECLCGTHRTLGQSPKLEDMRHMIHFQAITQDNNEDRHSKSETHTCAHIAPFMAELVLMEETSSNVYGQINEQHMVWTCNKIFTFTKTGDAACYNMGEPGRHYAKWNRPDTEVQPCTDPLTRGNWTLNSRGQKIEAENRQNGVSVVITHRILLWEDKNSWKWMVVMVAYRCECSWCS